MTLRRRRGARETAGGGEQPAMIVGKARVWLPENIARSFPAWELYWSRADRQEPRDENRSAPRSFGRFDKTIWCATYISPKLLHL